MILQNLSLIWSTALDWLFPPVCANCGRIGEGWCVQCWHELDSIPLHPIMRQFDDLVVYCTHPHRHTLRNAIHALKYENLRELSAPLGERLADHLEQWSPPVDLIVSVPIHPERRAQRGYNQSELLAAALARQSHLPYRPDALHKTRHTPAQVGLSAAQRVHNVADSFSANAALLTNKRALIIDDVCTTGATLIACAEALKAAGAAQVYAMTLSTPAVSRK